MASHCALASKKGFWPHIQHSYPECCSYRFTHRCSLRDVAEDYIAMAQMLDKCSRQLFETRLPTDYDAVMSWADALNSGISALQSVEAVRQSNLPVPEFLARNFFPELCNMHRQLTALFPRVEEDIVLMLDYDALDHLGDLVLELAKGGAVAVPRSCGKDGNCLVNGISFAVWGLQYFAAPVRDELLRELEDQADWYRQQCALGSEYDLVLQEVRERDAHEGIIQWINPKALGAMANLVRRPVCLVDSLQAMRAYGREVEIGEGMCDPDRFGIFLPSRVEPVTLKPLVLAWSSPLHNHFVPFVGMHGFPEPQLPFFPAVEGPGLNSSLCATRQDEARGKFSFAERCMEASTIHSWSSFVKDFKTLVSDLANVHVYGKQAETEFGYPVAPERFQEVVVEMHIKKDPKAIWDLYKFNCGKDAQKLKELSSSSSTPVSAKPATVSSSAGSSASRAQASEPSAKRPRLVGPKLEEALSSARRALSPSGRFESSKDSETWLDALKHVERLIEERRNGDFVQKISLNEETRKKLQVLGAAGGEERAGLTALELMGWAPRASEPGALFASGCLERWGARQDEALAAFEAELQRMLQEGGTGMAVDAKAAAAPWSQALSELNAALAPEPKLKVCTKDWAAGVQRILKAVQKRRAMLRGHDSPYKQILSIDDELRRLLRLPGTSRPDNAALEVLELAGWSRKQRADGIGEELYPVRPAWAADVADADFESGLAAFAEALRDLRTTVIASSAHSPPPQRLAPPAQATSAAAPSEPSLPKAGSAASSSSTAAAPTASVATSTATAAAAASTQDDKAKELVYRLVFSGSDGQQLKVDRFAMPGTATFGDFSKAVQQRLDEETKRAGRPAPGPRLRFAERMGQRRRDFTNEDSNRPLAEIVRHMSMVSVESEKDAAGAGTSTSDVPKASSSPAAPAEAPAAAAASSSPLAPEAAAPAVPANWGAPATSSIAASAAGASAEGGSSPPASAVPAHWGAAPAPATETKTPASGVPSHWLSSASSSNSTAGSTATGTKNSKGSGKGSKFKGPGNGAASHPGESKVREMLQDLLRASRALQGNPEAEEEFCREVAVTAMRVLMRHSARGSGPVLPTDARQDEESFRAHLKRKVSASLNEFQTELYKQNRWLAKVPAEVLNDEESRMWEQVLRQMLAETSGDAANNIVVGWIRKLAHDKQVRLPDAREDAHQRTMMSALLQQLGSSTQSAEGVAPPASEAGAAGSSAAGSDSVAGATAGSGGSTTT